MSEVEEIPKTSSHSRYALKPSDWKPRSPKTRETIAWFDKVDVVCSGPQRDEDDRYVYDRRALEEMDAGERYEVRAQRAELALSMGCAITPEEQKLLGLR